ncbi:Permease OS=Tsukamurella paurometabola (strain ATCC 8368 / DSM / CCUG 35730 / CIP 100753 / JCM 10117 / KCTC 9821 / NBRC 16120 / NCIMB 702349 / NCTC 13040)OX=521096 GN=Tpau_0139 PE=4 SV=1 [Tsukamurella paurometabola]|uniref:Permease n=1 Tax=Tsukamurella paurometabola (strain ATCC 8368 / DSM 20162 / CCUG 35730 / CIP 100753 / JCM 10117 / KCTC 9821 / NBRC 16120 / NCIMB 702349 / NCTC 13040) TaxID=521096 RepID=D5UQ25_TSUPD|nr:hypothetical protein [Tsukamurella paurometabola]ADG76793.1 hypothetical protein Tpau_0139 [Tsukamurella paurometabola DSM 20162]SUP41659.1 Uncharacterised protein [Tsukamurella paurometabola]
MSATPDDPTPQQHEGEPKPDLASRTKAHVGDVTTRARTHADDAATRAKTKAGDAASRAGEAAKRWLRRAIVAAIVVAVLVAAYFALAAYLPRKWADLLVGWVGTDGGTLKGTVFGLGIGFLCAGLPLLLLWFAAKRAANHPKIATVLGLIAVIATVPNLMTLAVAIGTGSGASYARTKIDQNAAGFRWATLIGVVIGVIAAIALAIFLEVQRRKRAKKKQQKALEKEAKAAQKQAEKDAKAAEKALKSGHAASSLDDEPSAPSGGGTGPSGT